MEHAVSNILDWGVKLATLVGIMVGLFRIKELHLTMNSRLDQLLDERGRTQRAEGVAEGLSMDRPAARDPVAPSNPTEER